MASKKMYVDLDMRKNELLNTVVENLSSHPSSPVAGQIYYNTVDETIYSYTGSVWIDLGDIYDHPSYTALNPTLSGANVLASISVDELGHVDGASTRALTLGDLGYTGDTDANKYVHPTFSGNDLGAELAGAEIISDVNVNGDGHVTGFATRSLTPADIGAAIINDSVTNGVDTWSSTKIQAELDAINSTVAGALVYKGGYNAGTNSPNLDSAPGAGSIDKGNTYTVTSAGTFYGVEVQVGDMLIAEVDDPSAEADWTIVNKNIPDIVDATESDKGIIKIATQALVDAGVNDTDAVTPLKLQNKLDAELGGLSYSEDIGDGSATSINVAHGLGSSDVVIKVKEIATGETIEAGDSVVDANTVNISFNSAPAINEFRVTVLKG